MRMTKIFLSAALAFSATSALASGTGTVCNQQAPVSLHDKTAYVPKIRTKSSPSQQAPAAPVKSTNGIRG